MFLYGTKICDNVVMFPFHYNLSHILCLQLQTCQVYKSVKE